MDEYKHFYYAAVPSSKSVQTGRYAVVRYRDVKYNYYMIFVEQCYA